ncbi:hypothetical protein SDC9_134038 [bioreactor metagenome]|uniref:Uncharacterized protein n=1 Tax=bioreactor metagenome TaxID=1076179 RepID=A0A645DCM7_9ZZZZ
MAVDDGNHEIILLHKICHIVCYRLSFIIRIEDLLLHHSLTHRSHLRTAIGVDDPRYYITAKSGTYLVQQIFIGLSRFSLFVISNFK